MRNKILILLFLGSSLFGGLSSCDDDSTSGLTGITYYPSIEMNGESTVFIAKGDTYTDAGAVAVINGEEVEMTTTSNVNTDEIGVYAVSYSATNSDGFSTNASRDVYVYDPNVSTEDISGTYTANVTRTDNGTGATASYSGNPVTLTSTGVSGLYAISDWIGGYYDVGYDYGSAYAFDGYIQINADNNVIEISMNNAWDYPFGEVVGTYNSITGIISYTATWSDDTYTFAVNMSKE